MGELHGQMAMLDVLDDKEKQEEQQYFGFVDKFKPKLTTDDCYTPALVYDAVADWVAEEYGISRDAFVRPFWPGGDYERHEYPAGCAVVDNPPFSIITKVVRFYAAHGIRFFLFAPALTLFAGRGCDVTYIPCGVTVTYENGAEVATSFITNLESLYRVRTAPELYRRIEAADEENQKQGKVSFPKYAYPDNIITAAIVQRWSKYGVDFRLKKEACTFISVMDAQRQKGKSIFGGGWLLSSAAAAERAAAERAAAERAAAERAAAERAAAERAAATRWALSEREQEIVRKLDGEG